VGLRPATPRDLDAVFDLLTVRGRAAVGISELTHDELANVWRNSSVDRFVFDAGGAVDGYAALDAGGHIEVAAADAALNDALLARLEERARQRELAQLTAIVVRDDVPFDALVRRSGFSARGEVLRMWRALDGHVAEPAWPDGVTVRTYRDADARRVQSLLDEAYTAWDDTYVPRSADDWLRWMTAHDDFDPALWFLVARDGELVACALHWKEHQGRGWVKDLVVRADERGNGLGRALLEEGFRAYAQRGAERVGLKVDSTNPTGAVQLYERAGFLTDRRYGIWVKTL
jgi:ribosomal protein S18 acetylase RimI-like enzyme